MTTLGGSLISNTTASGPSAISSREALPPDLAQRQGDEPLRRGLGERIVVCLTRCGRRDSRRRGHRTRRNRPTAILRPSPTVEAARLRRVRFGLARRCRSAAAAAHRAAEVAAEHPPPTLVRPRGWRDPGVPRNPGLRPGGAGPARQALLPCFRKPIRLVNNSESR